MSFTEIKSNVKIVMTENPEVKQENLAEHPVSNENGDSEKMNDLLEQSAQDYKSLKEIIKNAEKKSIPNIKNSTLKDNLRARQNKTNFLYTRLKRVPRLQNKRKQFLSLGVNKQNRPQNKGKRFLSLGVNKQENPQNKETRFFTFGAKKKL